MRNDKLLTNYLTMNCDYFWDWKRRNSKSKNKKFSQKTIIWSKIHLITTWNFYHLQKIISLNGVSRIFVWWVGSHEFFGTTYPQHKLTIIKIFILTSSIFLDVYFSVHLLSKFFMKKLYIWVIPIAPPPPCRYAPGELWQNTKFEIND